MLKSRYIMPRIKGYVVKLIPKHKGSDYPSQILKPYKGEMSWSKYRANKEGKFALTGKLWTGLNAKEVYKYKVIRG